MIKLLPLRLEIVMHSLLGIEFAGNTKKLLSSRVFTHRIVLFKTIGAI